MHRQCMERLSIFTVFVCYFLQQSMEEQADNHKGPSNRQIRFQQEAEMNLGKVKVKMMQAHAAHLQQFLKAILFKGGRRWNMKRCHVLKIQSPVPV
mmetsp:Transcript_11277/g.25591  ORF Transcript_11277/g.25591 Transcript_11277/m.25591 type:complete len:96 (-) Transcript_11277:138-425(-)